MGKILLVQTEHVIPFKTLIEVLKEVLTDVVIEFRNETFKKQVTNNEDITTENDNDTENKNQGGIRIMTVDSTKSILINLKLDASQFTIFECKQSKLELGVNLSMLNRLIRSMDKDDTLTLYVEDDNRQYLGLQIDNNEKKYKTNYRLKLMDLDNHILTVPATEFDAVITMSSSEFHKLCREMSHIAEYIEIKCTSKSLCFTCKGDCAERSTTYYVDDNGVCIRHSETVNNKNTKQQIIQGIYELKNLVLFTKCSNLCNDIQIFMKNNYPLVIRYTIATLGRVLLCLTPISDPYERNNYSDNEEVYSDDNEE